MTIPLLLLVLVVGLGAGIALTRLAGWRHPARVRRVMVNFTDPEADAIRGVLLRQAGDWLVVAQAELLRPEAALRFDGDVSDRA